MPQVLNPLLYCYPPRKKFTNRPRINACDLPDRYEQLKEEYESNVCVVVCVACLGLCRAIGSLYILARSYNIPEWTLGFKN